MISFFNNISSRLPSDYLWAGVLGLLAALTGSLLLLVLWFLLTESWPALHHLGLHAFVTDVDWAPSENLYLLTPMLWGTLGTTLGALLLATPFGILSAIFCQEYAPPSLAAWYRRIIELLAGIPSVVFGFWGLMVLVPLIGRLHPPGPSLLAGILVLFLMILPTMMLTALGSLQQVPVALRFQATSLGLGRWTIIWRILLPAAKSGIMTGLVLSLARALGETMAVLMVCGNVVQTPSTLFDPIRTLTANIALEMAYALDDHRSALYVSGLLLMGAVGALIFLATIVQTRGNDVVTR